ncbi:hypothetical protein BG000_004610 [Podila horticola]|nr:hypothetical protein BG000_004610 [Podila horticola]
MAQDQEYRQLLRYTAQLNGELSERTENLYMFLGLTQDRYGRCLGWLIRHPEFSSFATEAVEGHRRATIAMGQAERQFSSLEDLMEEILLCLGTMFAASLETGDIGLHTPPMRPKSPTISDQESSDGEDELDLERHHILTLDRRNGELIDEAVHLAPVADFSLNIPAVEKLIKRIQELRNIRHMSSYQKSSWSRAPSLEALIPLLEASVTLQPVISGRDHIWAINVALWASIRPRILGG